MKSLFFCSLLIALAAMTASGQAPSSEAKLSAIKNHLAQGEAALRVKDPDTAAREFRAVLTLDPRNVEAHTNLGLISFLHGDCNAASDEWRKALAVQPTLYKAQALLGICQERMGNPAARGMLEKAFAKLDDPALRTQVGMGLVSIYYDEGNVEKAVATTQKLVEINPESPDVLYSAQRLYSELADATLNKLAIVAPTSARMEQVIAERLINAGALDEAIPHYRKALELDPRLHGIHYELAQAFLQSSRYDAKMQAAAQSEIEEAEKVEGNSSGLECLLGWIALLQEDTDQAAAHYNEAFKLDPRSTEAQLGLGRVLMTMNKPQEARKYLRMATESDPLNNQAHYRLAIADRKLGLEEEAQKEARLAKEIKTTRDNVERLYLEMHKQTKSAPGDEEDQNEAQP